jgi:hypothetical protein
MQSPDCSGLQDPTRVQQWLTKTEKGIILQGSQAFDRPKPRDVTSQLAAMNVGRRAKARSPSRT